MSFNLKYSQNGSGNERNLELFAGGDWMPKIHSGEEGTTDYLRQQLKLFNNWRTNLLAS